MKILKRLFCNHEKQVHVGTYLSDEPDGSRRTRHIWQCKNCGKMIWR
nr:MAG TPA: hypothetical protein [Caudoviricetes sp.]DAR04562.1 MAG TPA: hypothetical protein [Bacteriophage sp.]